MKLNFGKKLASLFGINKFDESFYEQFEDMMIEGDLGGRMAMKISDEVRALAKSDKPKTESDYIELVQSILGEKISAYEPAVNPGLNFFLILGVNGVGKTTSVAKMADYFRRKGKRVILAAADTFRAAAIDQLETHGERLGIKVVHQDDGSDPGAVVYDTISSAIARNDDLIIADTAGRMHTKSNLVRELEKIDKIVKARIKPENYKKFLVIDSTTGQNGVSQAELFNQAIGLDAIILTKYDSAAKGGAIVQIGEKLSLPVAFVGTGEGYGDFELFNKKDFLNALVGKE